MNPPPSNGAGRLPRWLSVVAQTLVAIGFVSGEAMTYAEDLGVKAGTFLPDPDGREQLKDAVRSRQQSGELDRFWLHYRDQVLNAIRHPAPLPVRTVYTQATEFHAVSFTLPSDFVDQNGHVVAHKGQVIEPLAISPLSTRLIFIDGRDQQQVAWAIRQGQQTRAKIILTGGSPIDLREKYRDTPWSTGKGVPFYLDQRAMIINSLERFYGIGLRSVPAILTQQGKGLRIDYGIGGAQ
jgi:conjugal transfer pilus assembly protein TraW